MAEGYRLDRMTSGDDSKEAGCRRRQRNLTQPELAALVGRSQGHLANALRGPDPLRCAVVNRLRDILLAVQ
jgi:hypothetical protein